MSQFRDTTDGMLASLNEKIMAASKVDNKKEQIRQLRSMAGVFKEELARFREMGKTYTKVRAKTTYREIVRSLEFCHNYATTSADVLKDEYDPKDYDEAFAKLKNKVLSDTNSLILTLASTVKEEDLQLPSKPSDTIMTGEKPKVQKAAIGPKGFRSMFDILPVQNGDDPIADKDAERREQRLERYLADNKNTLVRYQTYKHNMPTSSSNKQHIVMRLPIVALTDPPVSPEAYIKAGYDVEAVGLYPILEDQVIIGIRMGSFEDKNKKPKKGQQNLAVTIDDVLQTLNAKSSAKYVLATDKSIGYHNTPYKFYWVTKERNLNRLYVGDGKFRVRQWGFAFS